MLQWIAMAVLTAAASLAVLAPLYRAGGRQRSAASAAAIYRDQLSEIDRDLARGVIADGDADAARTEIARRLIRAAGFKETVAAGRPADTRLATLVGAGVIPLAAIVLYLAIGAPGARDAPLAARQQAPLAEQDVAMLVARVEARLAARPEDGQGWAVIAPVYARLGRFDDAAKAYANANRILGASADREAGLGEAITETNAGVVTKEAREAFERARTLDPKAVRPRFFLALALGQERDGPAAIAAWQDLLKDAPPERAAWVDAARTELARQQANTAAPGPTAEDIVSAADLSPAERAVMIEGMVASLAQRLADQPDDPEGWARLIRSYVALGRSGDAQAALADARKAFAGNADRLAVLAALARSLGLAD